MLVPKNILIGQLITLLPSECYHVTASKSSKFVFGFSVPCLRALMFFVIGNSTIPFRMKIICNVNCGNTNLNEDMIVALVIAI